jgi:CheY-like chemotaxis protein
MKKTTYLVDDHPGCLATTEAVLRQHGADIVGWVSRGKKALQEIPKLKPDLVFLDLVMPGLTGLECARQLKSKLADLKIFMLTGVADAHAAYASKLAGASAYLLKPVLLEELQAALGSLESNQHSVTAIRKSCPPASRTVNQEPLISSFCVSPRLRYPFDTAETYDAHEFPVFLTKRFFLIWSKNETVRDFWPNLAQANHFCVKLLADTIGVLPQEFSREWKKCFLIQPKESFNYFRRNLISRAIATGRTTGEGLSTLCGYSKASHLYENKALRDLLAKPGIAEGQPNGGKKESEP